jgi:hypothetical protein
MHSWLLKLRAAYPQLLGSTDVSRPDYVRHQVFAWAMEMAGGSLDVAETARRFLRLRPRDWLSLLLAAADRPSIERLVRMAKPGKTSLVQYRWPGLNAVDGVQDIREFAIAVSAQTV